MIFFYFLGVTTVVLAFGIFLTFKKKNWGMLWVFSLFLAGNLLEVVIPFLFQKLVSDNLDRIYLFPYFNSIRYLFYLIAVLILIQKVRKQNIR